MKIIKQKNGIYAARFRDRKGSTRTLSLKTRDQKEATKLAKESKLMELETAARVNALTRDAVASIVTGGKARFNTVLEKWLSWRNSQGKAPNSTYNYQTFIEAFRNLNDLGGKPLSSVTPEMVSQFVNSDDNSTKSTRLIRLTSLRMFFEFATIRSYIMLNPASKMEVSVDVRKLSHKQKEVKKRKPFTCKEYRKIVNNTDGFFRAAAVLSYWTGMRLGDIASLEWDSVGTDTIIVHTLKRDKRVELPVRHELLGGGEIIKILQGLDLNDSPYCFPSEREVYMDAKRKARLSTYFGRILKRLGIEGKSFHCFRHAFVSRMSKAKMSLEDIAKLVGHSSTQTTEIYKHE